MTTTTKNASVSAERFFAAIRDGEKNNLTPAQVADSLGMKILSFQQRLVALRKLFKATGRLASFPKLRDARGDGKGGGQKGKTDQERVLALLGELDAVDVENESSSVIQQAIEAVVDDMLESRNETPVE